MPDMCSDCVEEELPCQYCGEECYGSCDDPDTCPSCWISEFDVYTADDSSEDDCSEQGCRCNCHPRGEDNEVHELFKRKGVFRLLDMPLETREKIYGYAFSQYGNQRISANHRGTIHTELLGTCRQVYSEARHLPLTLNRLCFPGPLEAHDFLGFKLAPTVKNLFTGLEIEFHYHEAGWPSFLQQLAKIPIIHLGLTVKGGYPAEFIQDYPYLVSRFTVLKSLKSFNLKLASYRISAKANKEIQEEMRAVLIEGYVPRNLKRGKNKSARAKHLVLEGGANETDASEKAKRGSPQKPKKPFVFRTVSKDPRRRTLRSYTISSEVLSEIRAKLKQSMLSTHELLAAYATSLDSEATAVKIRLANALQAAETVDEKTFNKLTLGIWETLEEQFSRVYAARAKLSSFAQASTSHDKIPEGLLSSSRLTGFPSINSDGRFT